MIVSKEVEERQQWLNSLKVGDTVAVSYSGWGTRTYTVHKISKITPSRMIDVNGSRFNSDGSHRGGTSKKIEELTEEIKVKVLHERAMTEISKVNWKSLATQQLLDVLKIIQADEQK